MISHDMGCLLKELLMIRFIVRVIISWSGYCFCSILMTSIVMKSSSCWSLSLTLVSTLSFFPVYVVIFNHLRDSVIMIVNVF